MQKLSTNDFIERAIAVHDNRYDYSNSIYVDSKTKVKVSCAEHGLFEQTPANHLSGFGCKLCGLKNAGQYHKKNTKSFIEEAKSIHGDKYDYSLTEYRGARDKVKIICPIHGAFEQQSSNHLRIEIPCLKCSYEERGINSSFTLEDFINKGNSVHNNHYDYSSVSKQFKNLSDQVTIICPTHGRFTKSASNHVNGQGCPKCSQNGLAEKFLKSNEDFIKDAKKVHGNKYDYSNVEYTGAFDNVKITCPKDGVFVQSPSSHLGGIGCPKCSRRKQGAPRNLTRAMRGEFDDGKSAYVYVVSFNLPCSAMSLFKIGSGTGTRIKSVVNAIKKVGGNCTVLSQFHFPSTGEAIVYEHLAHDQVRKFQFVVPPEFKFHGHSEVFTNLPIFDEVEKNPTLLLFRNGNRRHSKT